MISGGAGAWRSRGSRDAMPKPVSQTWPESSTSTFSGLTSLWMRPRRWAWLSAADKPMAMRRTASQIDRLSLVLLDYPIQGFTTRILKNEDRSPPVTSQRERLSCPCRIEFGR